MSLSLHSSLKSSTQNPCPGFYLNGDPTRPGEPQEPAGEKRKTPPTKPENEPSKYVSPSYEDEDDDEDDGIKHVM